METNLYATIESMHSLSEKINFIRNATFDAFHVNEPGSIVELFIVHSDVEAMEVANAFAMCFEKDAIDREASSVYKKMMTILDVLDNAYRFENTNYLYLLVTAFNTVGFKRAKQCDQQALWLNHCCEKPYSGKHYIFKNNNIPDKRYRDRVENTVEIDQIHPNKRMR